MPNSYGNLMLRLISLISTFALFTLFPLSVFANETFQCNGSWLEKPWQKPLKVGTANGTLSVKLNNPNPNIKTLEFNGTWIYNDADHPLSITHFLSVITDTQYVAFSRMMNVGTTLAPPSFYSYTFNREQLELRREVVRLNANETTVEGMGRLSCNLVN